MLNMKKFLLGIAIVFQLMSFGDVSANACSAQDDSHEVGYSTFYTAQIGRKFLGYPPSRYCGRRLLTVRKMADGCYYGCYI